MGKKKTEGIIVLTSFYFITWIMYLSTAYSSEEVVYGDYRDLTRIWEFLAILMLPVLQFGIFNLKEVFRKIAVMYETLNILVVSFLMIAGLMDGNDYRINKYLILGFMFLLQFCVPVSIIYFLTRSKVKEQFKP